MPSLKPIVCKLVLPLVPAAMVKVESEVRVTVERYVAAAAAAACVCVCGRSAGLKTLVDALINNLYFTVCIVLVHNLLRLHSIYTNVVLQINIEFVLFGSSSVFSTKFSRKIFSFRCNVS